MVVGLPVDDCCSFCSGDISGRILLFGGKGGYGTKRGWQWWVSGGSDDGVVIELVYGYGCT